MTDFHSHILPGVDDGSGSVETSLAMLRMEAEQGIDHVIATPHFYPQQDSPERFLQRREQAMARLQEMMTPGENLPKVTLGAEVYFYRGMSESDQLSRLTIEGKNCILIEMPDSPWQENHYRELEGIYVKHGITPIIAHVELCDALRLDASLRAEVLHMGARLQINADSLLGSHGLGIKLFCHKLLRRRQVHFVASDAHETRIRTPKLKKAYQLVQRKYGEEYAGRIFDENARAVIENRLF